MNNGNPYGGWKDVLQRDREYPVQGKLGYFIDGAFRIVVAGDMARYYVRFDGGYGTFLHKGRVNPPADLTTPEAQNIKVEIGWDAQGDFCILGLNSAESHAYFVIFGYGLIVPAHSHVITDMSWIGAHGFTAGNVLIADGTQFNSDPLANYAILHSMISAAEGLIRKTGAGTYVAHKTNLGAISAPTVSADNTAGYGVLSIWTTATAAWLCLSAATGAAVWLPLVNGVQSVVAGSGIAVDLTDPANPVVAVDMDSLAEVTAPDPTDTFLMISTPAGLRKISLLNLHLTGTFHFLTDDDAVFLTDSGGIVLMGA